MLNRSTLHCTALHCSTRTAAIFARRAISAFALSSLPFRACGAARPLSHTATEQPTTEQTLLEYLPTSPNPAQPTQSHSQRDFPCMNAQPDIPHAVSSALACIARSQDAYRRSTSALLQLGAQRDLAVSHLRGLVRLALLT
jgi:hypothetical protein